MAFIEYKSQDSIPETYRVNDLDNIIQISSVNAKVMKLHYEFYLALMRKKSPLTRIQRESIAVLVSQINQCHY